MVNANTQKINSFVKIAEKKEKGKVYDDSKNSSFGRSEI